MQFAEKRTATVRAVDNMIFGLYAAYFILKPVYLWNSGLPQIADLTMMILIGLFFSIKKKFTLSVDKKFNKVIVVGLFLTYYVVLINLIWLLILNTKGSFVFPSIYFFYNFLVFILIIALYSEYGDKLVKITYNSVLISVLVQAVLFFIQGGYSGGRVTASFNNPNQLGYYGLISICILIYTARKCQVKTKWYIIGISSSIVLVLASLSKAAILSTIGVIVFSVINNYKKILFRKKYILLFIIGILLVSVLLSYGVKHIPLLQSVEKRISSIGEDADDSLEGRGYLRIIEYPKYWLFGAGEGDFNRFQNLYGREFHSTLGNHFVSYGLIGIVLFSLFLYHCLRKDFANSWYLLLFIMVYGLTHNGIRNSLLWILLAIIAIGRIPTIKECN